MASVEDLEAVSTESFRVVLGEHDLTVDNETDIAKYLLWQPNLPISILRRGFLVEEVVMHPAGEDIALLKLQVLTSSAKKNLKSQNVVHQEQR